MTSIAMRPPSVGHVRQQGDLPRPLDGRLQGALMLGARTRDAPRLNLAALGNERRQGLHVLVVDVVDLLDAEAADAAAAEESAATTLVPASVTGSAPRGATCLAHRSPPASSSRVSSSSPRRRSFSSGSGGRPRRVRRSIISAFR